MKLPRQHHRARVEMMPLLDIVFLVLVFFVYAMLTMSVDKAARLNLPESSRAQPIKLEALSLSITANGSMYLNKFPVTESELVEALQADAVNSGHPPSVKGYADGKLHYQTLYRVLDLVNGAGVTEIALQAAPSSGLRLGISPGVETHEDFGAGAR